jgi:hypothetical protein
MSRVYVAGGKQTTALVMVGLLALGLGFAFEPRSFDIPHLHVESALIEPTSVMVAVTSTASGMLTSLSSYSITPNH